MESDKPKRKRNNTRPSYLPEYFTAFFLYRDYCLSRDMVPSTKTYLKICSKLVKDYNELHGGKLERVLQYEGKTKTASVFLYPWAYRTHALYVIGQHVRNPKLPIEKPTVEFIEELAKERLQ